MRSDKKLWCFIICAILSLHRVDSLNQRSLVFVFDTTGSMQDDLNQLRAAAIDIVREFSALPNKPIYNYVLTPFNDPVSAFLPMTITTDPTLFISKLQQIYVSGGGDCPELALTGIIKALNADIKNPIVCVITDADAKDAQRKEEVIKLVQTTQAQINVLVTGACSSTSAPGYVVYDTLATASSGMVFEMGKSNVKEVILNLKSSLEEGSIVISSVFYETGGTHNNTLDVDDTMNRVVITLAGADPSVLITGPDNKIIKNVTTLMSLKKIKSVQIDHPKAGTYTITTTSSSKHRINMNAKSDFSISYGFSMNPPSTAMLSDDSFVPIKDEENYLSVVLPKDSKIKLRNAIVKGGSNTMKLELTCNEIDDFILCISVPFIPPDDNFRIHVLGGDGSGNKYSRLLSNNIKAERNVSPVVMIRRPQKIFQGDPVNLVCSIDSLVTKKIEWRRDGRMLKEFYPTTSSKLQHLPFTIAHAEFTDSGTYECSASNDFGQRVMTTKISVNPFPIVRASAPTIIKEFDDVDLQCAVENVDETARIRWYGKGKLLKDTLCIDVNILTLKNITREESDSYTCDVLFSDRHFNDSIQVTALYRPVIEKFDSEMEVREKEHLILQCKVDSPVPVTIYWKFDGRKIVETSDKLQLDYTISKATLRDAGHYYCVAEGRAGAVKATTRVIYKPRAAPYVKVTPQSVDVIEYDDSVRLVCKIYNHKGSSEYNWSFNNTLVQRDSNILQLTNLKRQEGGKYTCSLSAGVRDIAKASSQVNVIYKPTVRVAFDAANVNIGNDLKLSCFVQSELPVSIRWSLNDTILSDTSTRSNLDYVLEYADQEDSGNYVCTARNRVGEKRAITKIRVLDGPAVEVYPRDITVNDTTAALVSVHCRILNNDEKLKPSWYFNGRPITRTMMSVQNNNTLKIRNFEQKDNGNYSCVLRTSSKSLEDTATIKFKREVDVTILEGEMYSIFEDEDLHLNCDIQSSESITVSWLKDRKYLTRNSDFRGTTLKWTKTAVTIDDAGEYICTATNAVEKISRTIKVEVRQQVRPTVDVSPLIETVAENSDVAFHCTVRDVDSTASIYWTHNGARIKNPDVSSDHTLTFRNVHRGAKGEYACEVDFKSFHEKGIASLIVNYPPSFLHIRSDMTDLRRKFNAPISIDCDADGHPKPVVEWNFLPLGSSLMPLLNKRTKIDIRNMRARNEGVYTCLAQNSLGRISHPFAIYGDVSEKPNIIRKDLATVINVDEGKSLEISCVCEECMPLTRFAWMTQEVNFENENRRTKYEMSVTKEVNSYGRNYFKYTLSFDHIQAHKSGLYTCIFENSFGSDSVEFDVTVSSTHTDYD